RDTVEIRAFIGHAVETARAQIERHEHQLSVKIPPEPICVEGDPLRLAQLISNLLDNAAKYAPNGGEISLVAEAAGGEVRIRIRDNGIGIPGDRLDSIFGLYTQLEPAAALASSGLGLGLALVRTLANMHDGKVEVISDGPGRDSQFTIRLPISAGLQPVNSALKATRSSMAPSFPRILLVDDDEDGTEAMQQLLTMDGHTVRAARNGATALEQLSLFDPNVVLLDLGLPDMDGHQVALRMREQATRKDLLIIALTGYGREQDRRLSTAAGCDGHLVKPIQLEALKSFLAEAKRPVSS
ncbi:MAG: hybrid sensor histidine kinase/response regulator, partial [Gammaproteobacteria bacterium]